MKIDIEDYRIESTPECFTVKKIGVRGAKSKNKGEETALWIKYYPDFDQCLKSVAREMLLESNATLLYQVVEQIQELNNMISDRLTIGRRQP